ncbi:MAG: alpha/beta hydrolase [Pseudomonadales bacterium]
MSKDSYPITDWDDAYANASNIPEGDQWPARWVEPAANFRAALTEAGRAQLDIRYGEAERNLLDLFLPEAEPKGLMVFVHGGFWLMLDKSYWSHLAQGCIDAGYAVAMPSYTLCPEASIAQITAEVALAIECAAAQVAGPIRLSGHSAGGHLVTQMLCQDSPLDGEVQARIAKTVSISGVHDLRPLLNTQMATKLQLDWVQACAQSPVLKAPKHLAPLTCWVGSDERPEFVRLNRVQADIWKGFALATEAIEEPDRHHFNIIDGLCEQQHPLTQSLLA